MQLPNKYLLENIFLQSPNVIAITNADLDNLIFEFVNPAFLEMTGYSLAEIIGASPTILQGPKTNYKELIKLKKACLDGVPYRGGTVNYKKDGTFYDVGWSVSPIKNKHGVVTNFLSIQKDITKIRQLEEEILKNNKIETIETISSGLTHEINTLITSCKGSMEMMSYDIENIENQKTKEYLSNDLHNAIDAIAHIQHITKSLHYITNHNIDILEDVDVYETLMKAVVFYKPKIDKIAQLSINCFKKNKKVNIQNSFTAKAKAEQLQHLFMIIIDNALDELVKNEHIEKNFIDINIKDEKDILIVEFKDNAGGIDDKHLKKIFEPLFKNKELGGMGLGLYIAKNIVKQFNGTLEVSTKKNTSLFKIVLNKK